MKLDPRYWWYQITDWLTDFTRHRMEDQYGSQYAIDLENAVKRSYILENNPDAVIYNVHAAIACVGRPCPIHNLTDHHMRDFPQHWREDRGIMERICEHGIGHPDPDQFEFWRMSKRMGDAVHGCDGCCTRSTPAVLSQA